VRKSKGRAWIELDMNNLRHNLHAVRDRLPDNCQLMASVKANAYGHGAVEICRELSALGVHAFCVASVMEGVELRRHRIVGEILILGYTHPEQFSLLMNYKLTQTVLDLDYAALLNDFGETHDETPAVHVKIDTGLRRLGERSENLDRIIRIFAYENLTITGIFTHFSAENDAETEKNSTQKQAERFHRVCAELKKRGFDQPKAHVQSSYGILKRPDLAFDYARAGRMLYGTLNDPGDSDRYGVRLRPVLSLKARVSAVKTVFAGEQVGYGFTFVAPKNMRIAVLAIGYADGLPRSLSCGIGSVLIDGHRAPILGCICMDQAMVDVTSRETVKRGDTVVVIGTSGGLEISACDVAEQAGTISTEILSRLGSRLEHFIR
jgi:serine/alanine racemase